MIVRRATRAAAVALLLLTIVTVGSRAPAGAQVGEPTVTVSPAGDLVDGQMVQLSGAGFPANTRLWTGQCPPGAGNDPYNCDLATLRSASVDAEGTFTVDVPVRRFLLGGVVDCAAGGCTIGATDLVHTATAPTGFLDVGFDEQLSVAPTDDLADQQRVTVSGTGYQANARAEIAQCGPGVTSLTACSYTNETSTSTDAEGAFTTEIAVARLIPAPDGSAIDCAAVACSVGVRATRTVQFVPITFAAVPAPAGSITVTPSTALLDDQVVEVVGTGFAPGVSVSLLACRSGAFHPISSNCERLSLVAVEPDASGSFTVDLRIERYIGGDDCLDEIACAVVGFSAALQPLGIEAGLSFADVPPPPRTVEVVTADLAEGDRAAVVGSGFRPDAFVNIRQCPAAPTSANDCSPVTGFTETDSEGTWGAELPITRVLRPVNGPVVDCLVETCTIGVTTDPFVPVSGALDLVDPEVTVDLHPDATLLAGTDEVVAQLTVSCEATTHIAVRAAVSQPGIEGTWIVEEQRCTPDEPLLVFVPTRTLTADDTDFALGEAQLTATVAATDRYLDTDPPSVRTAASGTVELHDEALIRAVVQAAIADPANTELRAEVVRAIQARLRQDPVFRAEWYAGLG